MKSKGYVAIHVVYFSFNRKKGVLSIEKWTSSGDNCLQVPVSFLTSRPKLALQVMDHNKSGFFGKVFHFAQNWEGIATDGKTVTFPENVVSVGIRYTLTPFEVDEKLELLDKQIDTFCGFRPSDSRYQEYDVGGTVYARNFDDALAVIIRTVREKAGMSINPQKIRPLSSREQWGIHFPLPGEVRDHERVESVEAAIDKLLEVEVA